MPPTKEEMVEIMANAERSPAREYHACWIIQDEKKKSEVSMLVVHSTPIYALLTSGEFLEFF
jgi:hypothetical protein